MTMTVLCALVLGCATSNPEPPSALPTLTFPAVLTIAGRGNPAAIVTIGTVEVARITCDVGAQVAPNDPGLPALPWDVRVVRLSDGRVLLSNRITDLPKWITIIGTEAAMTTFPVAGPPGPSCAPGS